MPHALGDLGLQLTGRPAGVAGEDPQVPVRPGDDLDRGVEVQQPDGVEQRSPARAAPPPGWPRWPGRWPRWARPARRGTAAAARRPRSTQSGSTASSGVWEISLRMTPSAPSASAVEHQHHGRVEHPVGQQHAGHQQVPGRGSRSAHRGRSGGRDRRSERRTSQPTPTRATPTSRPAHRAGHRCDPVEEVLDELADHGVRHEDAVTTTDRAAERPSGPGPQGHRSKISSHRQRRSRPACSTLSACGNQRRRTADRSAGRPRRAAASDGERRPDDRADPTLPASASGHEPRRATSVSVGSSAGPPAARRTAAATTVCTSAWKTLGMM